MLAIVCMMAVSCESPEASRESNELNIGMWPINQAINGDESLSYDEAIVRMKDSYEGRISSIDAYIRAL